MSDKEREREGVSEIQVLTMFHIKIISTYTLFHNETNV
jgi:hypothetical protein